jgi:hypothetical protein
VFTNGLPVPTKAPPLGASYHLTVPTAQVAVNVIAGIVLPQIFLMLVVIPVGVLKTIICGTLTGLLKQVPFLHLTEYVVFVVTVGVNGVVVERAEAPLYHSGIPVAHEALKETIVFGQIAVLLTVTLVGSAGKVTVILPVATRLALTHVALDSQAT